ncbi:GNAT family N-acetyltransferase [Nostoc sp. FACHB-87]|uniref:GNAT family N-acetyltransferase n=1 Tax=Nostocales TaxID=1161 RepID=UPI0016860767|nr:MULTISPECIES: GNAT family N-acetyltransferase [Nostocales]MBD2297343.1 GNAT family N-acetyltransferase [Nostoc sp. FACHB-190]MBD2452813.1 GNAT family N-acetyltransferase [Nostoc sp. FACHB-87]MBD2473744.1 GNAT family N-acetyltransferase [Anabaena sp. FACHB-83]MBD2486412.1 GNAT family N-acetyltransferase [Aulosira sp. FACHB-615]
MIRPSTPDDSEALIAIAVAAELFPASETEELSKVLASYFSGNIGEGHVWLTDEENGKACGVAYYAPAPFTDGTWDLLMIVVHPNYQRQGRGEALVKYVENALRASGQRILLVETSGLPSYERARAFYKKCGFEEEARIRDFYKAGEDKVVFRKALNAE